MKHYTHYILILLSLLAIASCSNDAEPEEPEHEVTFCVRAAWQNGIPGTKATRALLPNNILEGTGDIEIDFADYPLVINVRCSDGKSFTLNKYSSSECSSHNGFLNYTSNLRLDEIYTDKQIKRDNLTFTATAVIDPSLTAPELGDVLQSAPFGYEDITDHHHIQFTLHHTKALIRFAFKVSERYDKVRYIKVNSIKLNDNPCVLVEKVLNLSDQFIAYAYVDPTVVTTSTENTILCTYDIYDKDAVFPTESMTADEVAAANAELQNHLTRHDVTAKNSFTFDKVVFSSSAAEDHKIKAGYYYDLKVTLNPDYLYVLSDHDNQHLTISK